MILTKFMTKNCTVLFLMMLIFPLTVLLSGCNINSTDNQTYKLTDSNILVIYFSATGNTEQVATYIQNTLNASIYEITPTISYSSADLNWGNNNSRVNYEHNAYTSNDTSSEYFRPNFVKNLEDIDSFDTIFIGYPLWWGNAPNIVYSFVEHYADKLNNKIIIPFCTSASSPMGQSAQNIHNAINDNSRWLDGQRFSSNATQTQVNDWLTNLNITSN